MESWILSPSNVCSIDIETTGLGRECEIVSAAVAWRDGDVVKSEGFWLDRYCENSKSDRVEFQAFINRTILNPKYQGEVVFHNMDFDLKHLLRRFSNIKRFSSKAICSVSDTLTISRISKNNKYISHIDPKRLSCHSLKFLAKEFLGIDHTSFDEVVNHGNIRFANRNKVLEYNIMDAIITLKLHEHFQRTLDAKELSYLKIIEAPHLLNLLHMNWSGVPYDAVDARKWLQIITDQMSLLEKKIHIAAGSTFNISSQQELISRLFFNSRLTYKRNGQDEVLKPLYLTPTHQPKVDLETLSIISKNLSLPGYEGTDCINFINKVTQYMELAKSISFIESHLQYIHSEGDGYKLFPNFSAEAKSGRLKSSRPNLLGLPKKIYKRTNNKLLSDDDKEKSVRNLLRVPAGYAVWTIDINALDLTVVTHGVKQFNPNFAWIELFENQNEHKKDIHMAIAAKVDPKRYSEVLSPLKEQLKFDIKEYSARKPNKEGIDFFHNSSKVVVRTKFPDNNKSVASEIKKRRDLSKVINLSTTYMTGAATLALKLMRDTGDSYTSSEAQMILNNFYKEFPEIRRFQDEIGNKVYHQGYVQSVFGRKYFADVFDDLNEHFHESQESGVESEFEFVCKIHEKYWYLKTHSWKKEDAAVVKDLKVINSPFGFYFSRVSYFEQLDRYIFRKSRRKKSTMFQKKSEQQLNEVSDYELSRIGLTNEIDHQLSLGSSITDEANEILNSFVRNGIYFVPEKHILFYRVPLKNPSSKYFKFYKGFMKSVRLFFPLYCQGVAATVACMCLTQVRNEIESKNIDAQILLFVHDQIDVMVNEKNSEQMKELLNECVESMKYPFDIPLSGDISGPSKFIK